MMKVKKNKKLLAILLTTVMSLAALTGCGESPVESETGSESQVSATAEAPAATESASQEEVTINFWHHYSAQSAENETLMNVLIPEFEKENPGNYSNGIPAASASFAFCSTVSNAMAALLYSSSLSILESIGAPVSVRAKEYR